MDRLGTAHFVGLDLTTDENGYARPLRNSYVEESEVVVLNGIPNVVVDGHFLYF